MSAERKIVERLAAMAPQIDGLYWPTICVFCNSDLHDSLEGNAAIAEHKPDCLWCEAVKLVGEP